MNNIIFIIVSVLVMVFIIISVKKSTLSIKESFYWFLSTILMLILSIFPNIIDSLAKVMRISYPPSLLFVICIIFLVLMIFRSNNMIADQNEKIRYLIQEISILKDKKNDKGK